MGCAQPGRGRRAGVVPRPAGRSRDVFGVPYGITEQALRGECADEPAEADAQAGPFLLAQRAQNSGLALLPASPHARGHDAALRGEMEPDVALVRRVAPAPDPAFALEPGGQPADRALLEPEQAGQFALRDAPRGEQLEQRAPLGRRSLRPPPLLLPPPPPLSPPPTSAPHPTH